MKPFQHIFFDLDHTLWDFERSAQETLHELFNEYQIQHYNDLTFEQFLGEFYKVNYYMWSLYDVSKITKDEIRVERFPLIFKNLDIQFPLQKAAELGNEYLFRCPQKPHTIEHAHAILDHLRPHYQMHILTNGFDDVQAIKLKSAGLDHYFDVVVTSESTGHKKPSPQIFEYALQQAKATLENTVMIGDSLTTDVAGAINIGMSCIFFNPEEKEHSQPVMAEVKSLLEIRELL